ncbi:exosome complex component MTR3-like isoform X2 [Anneissia japonica]|uniref:exosome complex component MTR3-like isoform X2 n=1 Tax=Anneissia japonica TaxID=1529436 RepID=UPI001425B8B9|nr:exosome complex component MTR3-like isoform X2 [Anneissia japonica]
MPTDTKRVPGPEVAQPYQWFYGEKEKPVTVCNVNKYNREDGRMFDELRPVFLKAGIVSQSKGSAYMEVKNTKVICAVYGPHEVDRREDFQMNGQLRCEFKFATFACRARRQHQSDAQEKEFSVIVQKALESAVCLSKFPKAQLDIFVTVLEDGGSCLAAALTCASAAVADAGIDMYDVAIGCTVKQIGERCLIDPTFDEEQSVLSKENKEAGSGRTTICLLPSINQISAFLQEGELDVEASVQGMQSCIEGCQRLYPVVHHCLIEAVKKKFLAGSKEVT